MLSIVIPAKNEEVLLPKLLESLKAQTYQDFEIIVADAFSTDETRNLATSSGARVVDGGLPGPGRNRGATFARGDILLFLDADALLSNSMFLEDGIREIEERCLDVATCRVHAHEGTKLDYALHEAYNIYSLAMERVLPHTPGACFFIRRNVHEVLGGFDESVIFAEDHEYSRRARKAGYAVGILRKHKIAISTRRYRKDGMMRIAVKFAYSELYMVTRGPIRHLPFQYDLDKPSLESEEVSAAHDKSAL